MPQNDPVLPRFLAEWYVQPLDEKAIADAAAHMRQSPSAAPASSNDRRSAVVHAVYVSPDKYAFMVFAADSADVVRRACENAGHPADRVTAALEAPPIPR